MAQMLLICTLIACMLCIPGYCQVEGVNDLEFVPVLHSILNDKIINFKRELMKALIGEKVREKRKSISSDVDEISTQSPVERDIENQTITCFTKFILYDNEFLFVGGLKGNSANVLRFDPQASQAVTSSVAIPLEADAQLVAAFVHHETLFLIISYYNMDPKVFIIRTDTGKPWEPIYSHQISTNGRTPSHFEFFTVHYNLYVLITYQYTRSGKIASGSDVFLWNGAHFDKQSSLATIGATSASSFQTIDEVFLAISQHGDTEGNHMVGSVIFSWQKSDGQVKLIQNLISNGALHVTFFTMSQEIYLAFANEYSQSSIYWWIGDQFILWQKVPEPDDLKYRGALKWVVISSKDEPSLALALRQEIVFFIIDTSGQFSPYSVVSLESTFSVIYDFFFIRADIQYLVVSGQNRDGKPLSRVFKVDITPPHDKKLPGKDDPLIKCMKTLHTILEENKSQILKMYDGLPDLLTRSNADRINGSVVVDKGVIVKGETIATELALDETSNLISAPEDLKFDLDILKAELFEISRQLPDLLLRNDPNPELLGGISAPSVVAEYVHIDNAPDDIVVNNVSVGEFLETRLRKAAPQVVDGDMSVKNLIVENLQVKGKVNGIDPRDFMTVDGDQVITGNHHYSHVLFTSDVFVEPGVTINGINLNDVVRKDVKFQVVRGKKTFSRLTVQGDLEVMGTVNGKDLDVWAKDVVTLDTNQTLFGDYHFERLHVQGDVRAKTFDGIDVEDLYRNSVKLREPANITGMLIHRASVVSNNMNVNGTINGIVVPSDLITVHTNQSIKSDFVFKYLKVTGNLDSNSINGLDFAKDVVTTNGSHVINGNVTFNSPVSVEKPSSEQSGLMFETDPETTLVNEPTVFDRPVTITGNVYIRTLNGYDILNLHDHFWTKSSNQGIDRAMRLREANVEYNIEIDSLNGHPMSDYVNRRSNAIIDGPVRFEAVSIFHSDVTMMENSTVDGVDLSELNSKAVWKNYPQRVTGKKRFMGSVHVLGNVTVDGLVNGKDLEKSLLMNGKDNVVTGRKTIGRLIVKGNLINNGEMMVDTGLVNGHDFTNLEKRLVYIDEPATIAGTVIFHSLGVNSLTVTKRIDDVPVGRLFGHLSGTRDFVRHIPGVWHVKGNVRFEGPVTVLGLVNGINYLEHLNKVVRRGESSVITGRKVFTGTVEFRQSIQCKTVNGINLKDLEARMLSKSKDQVITGHYQFLGPVTVHNLYASMIDDVPVSELVFDDGISQLPENFTFDGDVTLNSNILHFNGLVNGCNLTEVALRLKDVSPIADPDFSKIRDLQIIGDVTFKDTLNGINIEEVLSNLVTKDDDQEITGLVTFVNGFTVDDLFVKTINGMDFNHFMATALRKSTDQILTGIYEFRDTVSTPVLTVKGDVMHPTLINGLDLAELSKQILTTDEEFAPVHVRGHKRFPNGLRVNNLVVEGLINGFNPKSMIYSGDQRPITEPLTFESPITIEGNLLVEGKVDGVNLEDFLGQVVTLDEEQVIEGNIIVEGDLEVENLDVTIINDIPVSELVTIHGDEIITGRKHFKEAVIDGNVLVRGSINGINLAEQQSKWAHVDRNEIFTEQNIFIDDVYMNGDVQIKEVNGIKVQTLPDLFETWKKQTAHNFSFLVNKMKNLNEEYIDNYINSQDSIKVFSYFDVFQTLEISNVKEINIFRVDSKLKIITMEKDPACQKTSCNCFQSRNLEVSDSGKVIVYDHVKEGKVFPFLSQTTKEAFFLWSNSTADSERCDQGSQDVLTVESFHLPDLDDILKWSASLSLQKFRAGFISDVQYFYANNQHFLVVLRYYDDVLESYNIGSHIYRFDAVKKSWEHHQTLETFGAIDIDIFTYQDRVYLALANTYDSTSRSHETKSALYRWDGIKQLFFLLREIRTEQATAILGVVYDDNAYLFLAQRSLANPVECTSGFFKCNPRVGAVDPVIVMKYQKEHDNFYTIGSLPESGVINIRSFLLADKLFIAMCSPVTHKTTIYQYKGVAGFLPVLSMPMYKVHSLATYEHDHDRYIIVGGPQNMMIYKAKLLTIA